MTTTTYIILAGFCLSTPYWLPSVIVNLRMLIFTRINGRAALQLPLESNRENDSSTEFRRVYDNPNIDGRSKGAALSDLFWYWLAPGPEMHQEHLENGPRYEKIAALTRSILAVPRQEVDNLIERNIYKVHQQLSKKSTLTRLRDLFMPFWACFYYEIVFKEPCPKHACKLIVDNANDVVTALKCCGLRHMQKRHRLTTFLVEKLKKNQLPHTFPEGFSIQEQAYYLQGAFFNTAIVQMSEAMTHLIMALAKHPSIQEKMLVENNNRQYYDHVIHETLRLYPLFGIAHRIASQNIRVNDKLITQGSVVCFNYPHFHQLGFEQAEIFNPDRWQTCPIKESNHIPFGVTSNRPCPAQGIALLSMRYLLLNLLQHYRFITSAKHNRSIPNRGPCLITHRKNKNTFFISERLWLLFMKVRDQWEELFRSIMQLVLGTIMIVDARRLRLCENYFSELQNETAINKG